MLKEHAKELFGVGYIARTKTLPADDPPYEGMQEKLAQFSVEWPQVFEVLAKPQEYGPSATPEEALKRESAHATKSLDYSRWNVKNSRYAQSLWAAWLNPSMYIGSDMSRAEKALRRGRADRIIALIDRTIKDQPVILHSLPDEINIEEPLPVGTKVYAISGYGYDPDTGLHKRF